MLKGVNKLIVEINNPQSEYFERAIFFVRPAKKETSVRELNLDADLILSQAEIRHVSAGFKKQKTIKEFRRLLLFLGIGMVLAGVSLLILHNVI